MRAAAKALVILTVLTVNGHNADANNYFRIVTDSVHSYTYDVIGQGYKLASVSYYYYRDGILDSIISASAARVPVSKTEYYRADGILTGLRTFVAGNGIWVPGQNQEMYYDDLGRLIRNVVTVWRTDHWENLNIFTQTFDEDGKLVVFHRDFWSSNRWNDFSTDSLFYDQDGNLSERSARLTSTGNYLTRILYNYSAAGIQYSQTRQNWSGSGWVNSSLAYYIYNKCGMQIASFGEKWVNGSWVADTRSVISTHYDLVLRARKVPVCFNGSTVFVLIGQLEKLLAAGACLGECIDPGPVMDPYTDSPPVAKGRKVPFIIYPNPAVDYVSIRSTDPECPVTRVELLDFSGRPVRNRVADGEELLTVDLSSLRRGNYILRITADAVYSNVISRR
jgi:hypothetical protein